MDKKQKFNLIFVCTGNTCRSPMAEFLFKDYLKRLGRAGEFSVSSAGLYAQKGSALSENAHAALDVLGVKHVPQRKARTFTVAMSLEADLIVAMSNRHASECGDGDNVTSFEELCGFAVPDPFGGSLQTYLECAAAMRNCFERVLIKCDEIKSTQNNA